MKRALLYVPSRVDERALAEQLDQLQAHCHAKHHAVVSVVRTLAVAEQMFDQGKADVLVLTSRTVLPFEVETIASAPYLSRPAQESPNLPGQRGRTYVRRRYRPRRIQ